MSIPRFDPGRRPQPGEKTPRERLGRPEARYESKAELAASRDWLAIENSAMFELVPDLLAVFDERGTFVRANPAAASVIGYPPEALVGQSYTAFVLAEDAGRTRQLIDRLCREGGSVLDFENRWRHRDGSIVKLSWSARFVAGHGRLYASARDVTARDLARKAQAAYQRSERRVRKIIGMTPAGYLVADATGTILDANAALCDISGHPLDVLIGLGMRDLFPNWGNGDVWFDGGDCRTSREVVLRHRLGHDVHVVVNANLDCDSEGEEARGASSVTAFVTDISGRKQTEARLERLALHDALTGLPNRAFLSMRLQPLLQTERRRQQYAMMLIDLDRFKEVNDSLGHKAGDILLQKVAARLSSAMRRGDIVCRLGGDEFIVVAACPAGVPAACELARRIIALLALPIAIHGQETFIGASIGITMFPEDGCDEEQLFQNADIAMYKAKGAGRNRYCFYTAAMGKQARSRAALESALRRTVKAGQFALAYQPRICLRSLQVTGVEALLRWHGGDIGAVSPTEFIPVAEDIGLMDELGAWALRNACRQALPILANGPRPLRLAVNLSARQLRSPNLLETVTAVLAETGFPARQLEFELTETAFVDDVEETSAALCRLKALGVLLSIEDFGTGYASLRYLREFPVDIVKLDRSFLSQGGKRVDGERFLKAAIDLAHALDLTVVAEGIEQPQTLNFLRNAGCDQAQGFLIAKPMPADTLPAFLASDVRRLLCEGACADADLDTAA